MPPQTSCEPVELVPNRAHERLFTIRPLLPPWRRLGVTSHRQPHTAMATARHPLITKKGGEKEREEGIRALKGITTQENH